MPFRLLLSLTLLLPSLAGAQTAPVVIVESFEFCGSTFSDGLMAIDPATGDRQLLIGVRDDGGSCTPVGSGEPPFAIQRLGWDPDGAVWIADGIETSSRLLRVGYPAGNGVVVSGCTSPAFGPCLGPIVGTGVLDTLLGDVVTITSATASPPTLTAGDVVVAISLFNTCGFSANSLLRIDPATGNRALLSGLDTGCQTTIGSGDPFTEINGLYATSDGTLLVADGDGSVGRLMEVDPTTGNRTVISGCDTVSGSTCVGSVVGTGPVPGFAHSVAPLDAGETAFASRMPLNPGVCFGGTILEIDRATGDRSILSGEDAACASVGTGEPFADLEAVAALPSFDLVTSEDAGIDRIFRVDGTTGERTVISGCTTYTGLSCVGPTVGTGDDAEGYGVLIVPEPSAPTLLGVGTLTLFGLARLRARRAERRFGPTG